MTLLVFGKGGQVSNELARQVPQARFLGRDEADLSQPETCADWIARLAPQAVINAAAFTEVDRAESEEALATRINGAAPAAMARACAALGVPMVQISTDYVFDGSGTAPVSSDHPPAPLGAYGRSKLAGEKGVRAAGGVHAILRTSWVFSAHGANFVRTMLRLGAERDSLRVVADQTGGPTPASAIAAACVRIAAALRADPARGGTYHLSGQPDTTWADFARAIMAEAGLSCRIEDTPTSAWPTPAQRPLNSRLDCASLKAEFGISRPDWQAALAGVVKDLKGKP
ncbi:dTDP-4-dehydrorhamnose reductase [Alkalilacustris brevis]|uniref:dTDP-4-dehydrorhamnose reductase n=1 Tax=Alkalilacustris brevis TaxID=2026338 RepID=UPI000E0DF414|nr:dTDP-4-dehydrorhamnose reductase [Alkalilacustris brevis]